MKHIKLYETHWKDKFTKGFHVFRSKYLKLIRKGQANNLYVQFHNYKGNTLDRTNHASPDHSDPAANYAYPIKYVVNNPADLWYGAQAKYLRVLEETKSLQTLVLNSISSEYICKRYLNDIYPDKKTYEIDEMMYLAKIHYKERVKGVNKWAKIFFQCLQVDFDSEPEKKEAGMFSKERMLYRIRGAEEQTNLLVKAGWKAIEDTAKKDSSAIINDREPEQIAFLTRDSFKVLEVFNLTGKDNFLVTYDNAKQLGRKWCSQILAIMDDKIKDKYSDTSNAHFFSVKGREISITFEKPQSYYDKKLGQKLHKANKLSDETYPKIRIDTEYGEMKYRLYADEEFNSLLDEIKRDWDNKKRGEFVDGWEPRTRERKDRIEKEEKDDYYTKLRKEEEEKLRNQIPYFKKDFKLWKDYFNSDINLDVPDDDLLKFIEYVEGIYNKSYMGKNIEKFMDDMDEIIYGEKDYEGDDKFILRDMFLVPGKIEEQTDEQKENATEFAKLLKQIAGKIGKHDFLSFAIRNPERFIKEWESENKK
jgi:hypothetical protein